MQNKIISVIGLGYIGLPTAALLASKGYTVLGCDINQFAVDTINSGKIHIVEPDLDSFVKAAVGSNKLKAYLTPQPADIHMICVPTPFKKVPDTLNYPEPDMGFVVKATRNLAKILKNGDIVILESTSPVGSTELVRDILENEGVDVSSISIAYCPERVLPGKIMTELVQNDRIVGGVNEISAKVVSEFYRTFVAGAVLETDSRTAEMSKLTENSFRDVNIAFANELSMICDNLGIDVWKLISLANRHPRVNILTPGAGVGGHCIAVDPWFIVHAAPENSKLISTARNVNNIKPHWVEDKIISKIKEFKNKNGRLPLVACMGLAFKPDIDDLRESPSLEIYESLNLKYENIVAVEPNITELKKGKLVDVNFAENNADVFVFLVKHKQFLKMKLDLSKSIIDICGVLDVTSNR